MTKAGFSFIAAGVFVYFLASQTQIGWLYLFDAIIWSLLVLSAIIPWYSLRSLQVERQLLLPNSTLRQAQLGGPLEDDTITVELKVTNNGRLARYLIKVGEDCPFEPPEKLHKEFLLISLKAKSTTTFSYTATCYRRGYYKSARLILQSSGLLGLMVRRRNLVLPLNLTVYPTYYQLEELAGAQMALVDWGQASRANAAAEFYGSREYQYGDPLKHIHWRNTARVGHFMLKEFEQTSHSLVTVIFDTKHNFGTGRETTLEYSIKLAASLSKLCADSGRSIDIIAGEKPLWNAGWQESMDYLAHLESGKEANLAELTRLQNVGSVVVAIVPTAETELIPVLSQLSDRIRQMVVVLLEGFTPNERREFSSRLQERNFTMITCSRGNLEATIKELSNSLLFNGRLAHIPKVRYAKS